LHEYVIYLLSLYNKYDLQYVIYGHAGNGNLHTRPILDDHNNSEDHLHSKQARILKNLTHETFKKYLNTVELSLQNMVTEYLGPLS
ncbi:MAG: hypothetical protein L0H53_02860, partial [Candidatus Nitrosocosmicus sp.]|nr:hypothetical protein [Candidatus Nitrosocosmicus sp.]